MTWFICIYIYLWHFVTTKAEVGRILTLGTCLHQCSFTALVSSAAKNININHKGSSPTMNTLRESSAIPQHYQNHGSFMVSIKKPFFLILHQLSLAVYPIVFEGVDFFSKVVKDFWTIKSMKCSQSCSLSTGIAFEVMPFMPVVSSEVQVVNVEVTNIHLVMMSNGMFIHQPGKPSSLSSLLSGSSRHIYPCCGSECHVL